MPTENRSSNTEMVSVPHEHELKIRQTPLADLLSGLKTGEIRACSDREFAVGDTVLLREIDDARDYTGTVLRRTITHVQKNYGLPDHLCVLSYGQPTPQPHPEPIAWMVGTAFWWTKEEAERDAAATGLPIVGLGPMLCAAPAEQHQGKPAAWRGLNELGEVVTEWIDGVPPASMVDLCGNPASFASIERAYTHADPGEAEDLLASTSLEFGERLDAVEKERDTLRAQLAEQSGLLKQADEFMYIMTGHDSHARLAHKYGEKWWDAIDKLRGKVCTALSASAEQSAPTSQTINGHRLFCKAVDDYKPGQCSCGVEINHEIPGTSFQRLNTLANQGE